jgi:arginyl-tRNA synthetase
MLHGLLEEHLRSAVAAVLPDADLTSVRVRPCPEPKFGDYQTDALMALARERRLNPRQFAAAVAARLALGEWCEEAEVAGAGFLNLRLKTPAIARVLQAAVRGEHRFYRQAASPRTVVIDFSSPNVAKPMHVGHIRSTILGDCLARTLRLLGHRVITDNHLGDWGTQFGKLLLGWKLHLDAAALAAAPIAEMERLYKLVNAQAERNPGVLEGARLELVKLQNGDPDNQRIWREMIDHSQREFDATYARLGVNFDHTLGESFYNPQLKAIVQQLHDLGLARMSAGASVVFFDDVPELKEHPAIILKRDGGANYTTTDLATLAYRLETWRPDQIIYVTDGRQQLHFKQLFAIFRRWRPAAKVNLAHVWFGSVLGEDGKPLRTRAGQTIKLADLLDEAQERALRVVSEKNPGLGAAERREIARIVGLGALKFADLLPNRQSDYVFSWDKMLALNGNTAPYLQYAYTRICSIFRKLPQANAGAPAWRELAQTQMSLGAPEEVRLAKHLLNFNLVLEAVAEEYRPNYLCNYLYELAGHFTSFYESCPVLKAPEPARPSRLALCELSGLVLRQGLEVLGIATTEKM